MKINKLLIIAGILSVGLTSCWENVEDIQGSGPSVAPGVVFVVFDADGNRESGVTVEVYSSYETFNGGAMLGSATTDANGEIEFGTDVLGTEATSFYVSAYTSGYGAVSWDGTVNTGLLLLTSGKTPVVLNLDAPTYATEISGSTEVISGTSGVSFSVKDYPGSYTWTTSSSNATIASGAGTPSVTINFTQNQTADETISIFVEVQAGTQDETFSIDVLSTQFCPLENGLSDLTGAWVGDDGDMELIGAEHDADVTMTLEAEVLSAAGFNEDWMVNFWGESILDSESVEVQVDLSTLEVTIDQQYLMTTLYNGDEYVYEIKGTGLVDGCTGSIYIEYDLYNVTDEYWLGPNLKGWGYTANDFFVANLIRPLL